MEKNKLDKLTAALEEAGYELEKFEEETRIGSLTPTRYRTGYILLRIHPVE
jgi:hypothetical protein